MNLQARKDEVVSYIGDSARTDKANPADSLQTPTSRVELGDILSDESKIWAALERLNQTCPSDPKEALESVSILFKLSHLPSAREELIKALRTESPKHFGIEEVRVEALRVLAKYSDEPRLASLALEELEAFPQRTKSCAEAVTILNSLPPIEDRQIVDRITELFIRERNSPDYKNILSTLTPQFAECASDHLAKQLKALSKEIYFGREQGSAAILAALALSRDTSCIDALCRLARQDFFEGSRLPKWANDILGLATAVGILVGPGAIVGAIISRHPIGAVIGGVVNFLGVMIWAASSKDSPPSQESSYKPRSRVQNEPLALDAISALRLSTAHWQARETLQKLSKDPTQAQSISGYAKQSLKNGRPSSNLEVLLRDLRDQSPELRELSLRGLAKRSEVKVMTAVTAATNDRDRGVRQVAYEALAQIRKNGATS